MQLVSERVMLLDTASLYFRAFYGLPDSLRAPDGTPVNAVRGLLDFVATLVERHRPAVVVACWDDAWRPTWRVDLLPSYKAHRVAGTEGNEEESPELLTPQVPLIREALTLLGVEVVGAADAEADDVIGTLATAWRGPVDVVTGDRDLFQLVDDEREVRVLYTARGVNRHEMVDDAWVHAKYGVGPRQYVDFAVLRGDPSDGLPGVAGIGEKTAAALLNRFGDLAGIVAAAADPTSDGLTPRVRRSLGECGEYLDRARPVVQVRRDLALAEPRIPLRPLDPGFAPFTEQWGLGGSADRVISALAPLR